MSDEQLEAVRQRLSGLWRLNGMEVYWMLPKVGTPTVVHALGTSGSFALCGAAMNGMWSRRRYVAGDLRCAACTAFLQEHGVLGP